MVTAWRIVRDAAGDMSDRGDAPWSTAIGSVALQSWMAVYPCVHGGAKSVIVRRFGKHLDFILYIVNAFNSPDRILNTPLQRGARNLAAQYYRTAFDGKVQGIKDN